MGFRQAAFLCPEKTCFGDDFGGVWGVSVGNFRGGRKPFPKPSGYFALPGANPRERGFTVRKSRTVFIHTAPQTGRMDAVDSSGYIFGRYAATSTGLRGSPCLRLSESDCREPPRIRVSVRSKPPYGGFSQKKRRHRIICQRKGERHL